MILALVLLSGRVMGSSLNGMFVGNMYELTTRMLDTCDLTSKEWLGTGSIAVFAMAADLA